jgi:ABC-2 type transport system ATP-binding protein
LFRTLLKLYVDQGRMVLFSSHRFDVVERLCSRVIILCDGTVVADDDVEALRRSTPSGSLEELFARVTSQEDLTPIARAILETVRT